MASVQHDPITGIWGQSPHLGPGAESLVRVRGPPEAESLCPFAHETGTKS